MNSSKNIFYVGYNGFPLGFAQIERQKLIAKGLIACGCSVKVISRYGFHPKDREGSVSREGSYEGISYEYASGQPFRDDSFVKRNLLKCKGLLREMKMIRLAKKNKLLDAIFITTNFFHNVFFYSALGFFYRVPVILDNVEHWTSIKGSKKLPEKFDNYFYDHYACRCVDKVIGISDFLVDEVKRISPGKPVIKVPAIVDFSQFKMDETETRGEEFLLYCGSAIYFEVLYFVVEAFEKADTGACKLYIVSNGTPGDMEKVKSRISGSSKSASIVLLSGLPYSKLVGLYMHARGLLIPLRDTPQDTARFPHKIGEYCAAGRTIISTNTGEIKNYFKDQINALLADDYHAGQFADKMEAVVKDPVLADEIGRRSYQTGRENFDHLTLGKKIYEFAFKQNQFI